MAHSINTSTYSAIKADVWRYHGRYSPFLLLKTALIYRTFRPVLTLRLCQAAKSCTPLLRIVVFPVALLMHRWTQSGASIDLPWRCAIGLGFRITHGWGLVIHDDVVIGSNVTVFHGVTIGSKRRGDTLVAPKIGNNVTLAASAIVIGAVTVGDGAIVGAGAIVLKDVRAYSVVVGEACREIQENILPRVAFPAPLA